VASPFQPIGLHFSFVIPKSWPYNGFLFPALLSLEFQESERLAVAWPTEIEPAGGIPITEGQASRTS
jgi:hypothetical protein